MVVTIRRKLLQYFVYSVGRHTYPYGREREREEREREREREREGGREGGTRDRNVKSRLHNANNSDLF